MRKSVTALAALLLLSACSSQPAQSEPASEPSAASQPTQEAAAEPEPGYDVPAAFGDTVAFLNGVEITAWFEGTEQIEATEGPVEAQVLHYELTNKSGARVDPDYFPAVVTCVADGSQLDGYMTGTNFTVMLDGESTLDTTHVVVPEECMDGVRVEAGPLGYDGGLPVLWEGPVK